MVNSFSRYMEPLFLGMLIFIMLVISNHVQKSNIRKGKNIGLVYCLILVVLFCNFDLVYKNIFCYNDRITEIVAERNEMKNDQKDFLTEMDMVTDYPTRVLFVTNYDNWPSTRRIQYEVCPNSVVFLMDNEEDSLEERKEVLKEQIEKYECQYIYFDEFDKDYLIENQILCHKLTKVQMDREGKLLFING